MSVTRRPGRTGAPVSLARLSDIDLSALDTAQEAWPGDRVVVDGVQLFVRRTPATGTGAEPALFVHGLGGSATNWTDLAAALRPWLDGESIDLPGFGRSGPHPRNDYSIGAFADVVIAYLEQSGRGPVHLFGNSMGGAVAIRIAAQRPDLVRTLTLVSPAIQDLRVRRPGTDAAMTFMLLPGVTRLVERRLGRLTTEQRVRGTFDVCYADTSRVSPQRFAEAIVEAREREHLPWAVDAVVRAFRGIAASYLATGSRSVWRLLGRVTAPTLVVWGEQDKLVDVALAPRAARSLPDSRLLVLPGVGHVAQMEDPVTTARAVVGMLEDVRASRGENAPQPRPGPRSPSRN